MKPFHIVWYFVFLAVVYTNRMNAQPIILTPKWTAQAQFTGYYVAEKLGFYKDEGLDVHVEHPSISESSFSYLKSGRSQAVVMNLSYALMERFSGTRVVNIMQTSQENSLMLVSRSPLKDLSSLHHKKIAVWNHLSQELLDQIADHYNLQVEWIRFNSGINLFLSGAVDICLMGSYNEFPQLIECGMKIDSTHVLRLADYGYNLPEDGLYVTEEYYLQNPETVRKLTNASIRGWRWAEEHRDEALNIVMEKVEQHNIGTNRYHQRKMLEEILRLQTNKRQGKRTYHLSEEDFKDAVNNLIPEEKQKDANIRYEDFVK